IMIPLLTFFSIAMGIFGGFLLSVAFFQMEPAHFFNPMQIHISLFDLATGGVKSLLFGVIIVTVCCYRGMNTVGGAAGVGKATTKSVVTSYILILIADFILILGLNNLRQFI